MNHHNIGVNGDPSSKIVDRNKATSSWIGFDKFSLFQTSLNHPCRATCGYHLLFDDEDCDENVCVDKRDVSAVDKTAKDSPQDPEPSCISGPVTPTSCVDDIGIHTSPATANASGATVSAQREAPRFAATDKKASIPHGTGHNMPQRRHQHSSLQRWSRQDMEELPPPPSFMNSSFMNDDASFDGSISALIARGGHQDDLNQVKQLMSDWGMDSSTVMSTSIHVSPIKTKGKPPRLPRRLFSRSPSASSRSKQKQENGSSTGTASVTSSSSSSLSQQQEQQKQQLPPRGSPPRQQRHRSSSSPPSQNRKQTPLPPPQRSPSASKARPGLPLSSPPRKPPSPQAVSDFAEELDQTVSDFAEDLDTSITSTMSMLSFTEVWCETDKCEYETVYGAV